MRVELKEKERLDDLGIMGYRIIQNPDLFCFGMDAVLLSAFAKPKEGSRMLDLCTGNGILPILLAAKSRAAALTGLEIQKESADMAARSVLLNHLEDRVKIVHGDVRQAEELFAPASFEAVTCNPPYMLAEHGLENPDRAKAIARHEVLMQFEDAARAAERLLVPGGEFYLVHRPFRLVELLDTLTRHQLEPKTMRFVYPFVDKEPAMVLIGCKKGAKRYVNVQKPLIIYERPNVYTREVRDLYDTEGKSCQ
ncbi:MAG: tRNA1(Val) (adenine(37)-N6)-methyltransferase [Lachnospiraceae bacterium]|nr:tRNA1(Val) (adenine(37)-N6)-methyltransferase [Lachnospiraceae bacterium]